MVVSFVTTVARTRSLVVQRELVTTMLDAAAAKLTVPDGLLMVCAPVVPPGVIVPSTEKEVLSVRLLMLTLVDHCTPVPLEVRTLFASPAESLTSNNSAKHCNDPLKTMSDVTLTNPDIEVMLEFAPADMVGRVLSTCEDVTLPKLETVPTPPESSTLPVATLASLPIVLAPVAMKMSPVVAALGRTRVDTTGATPAPAKRRKVPDAPAVRPAIWVVVEA